MSDIEAQVSELEHRFWHGDAAFYREHLSDDCRMALPGMGLIDRDAAVRGVACGPRWDEVEMVDFAIQLLGQEAAIVSYRAHARRGDHTYEAVIGSVYSLHGGRWKMLFHQQTV